MTDDDDDIPECDLGPWREPMNDDGEDDDESDGPVANRNATGRSTSAAVERWLRLPHSYSLSGYLLAMGEFYVVPSHDVPQRKTDS